MDMLKGIPNLSISRTIRYDDRIDQLHHYVTAYMFALLGICFVIIEVSYEPLDCFVSQEKEHVNSYCWATYKLYNYPDENNLSVVPYNLSAAGSIHDPDITSSDIANNKGTGIFFILIALLFKAPALFWSLANEYEGNNIEQMVSLLIDSTFKVQAEKKALMNSIAEYFEIRLKIKRSLQLKEPILYKLLPMMYIQVKVMFLVLDFGSLVYLNSKWLMTYQLEQGPYPVVVLCHFQVQGAGSWVQCNHTINMLLNSFIFLVSVWLFILLNITVFSLLVSAIRNHSLRMSIWFVEQYVLLKDKDIPIHSKNIEAFIKDYLEMEGIFVLRILETNINDVVMKELINCMWQRFLITLHSNSQLELNRTPSNQSPQVDLELEQMIAV